MSQETSIWLNTNTLIGFTEKRGHAWHYRAEDQGEQTNHYAGAIPVEDVNRRLFFWKAVEGDIKVSVMNDDGVLEIVDPERKAIVRPDTGTIMGIFKQGYVMHQYDEWLVDNISNLLDDDLCIGSAGLLKNGAVAWVSVEVPENIVTPEGVVFRPNLLASTSFDGSLATTYTRCVTNVVCDNTMSAALREQGQTYKIKHSRYSGMKLKDARDALAVVHTISDEFSAQVKALNEVRVSDKQWAKFVDAYAPVEKDGEALKGRGLTMAENKREELNRLWNHDERVNPWRGNAWGVVQAVNTYTHHSGIVRGADRPERNMLRAVSGNVDALDNETMGLLNTVLA